MLGLWSILFVGPTYGRVVGRSRGGPLSGLVIGSCALLPTSSRPSVGCQGSLRASHRLSRPPPHFLTSLCGLPGQQVCLYPLSWLQGVT